MKKNTTKKLQELLQITSTSLCLYQHFSSCRKIMGIEARFNRWVISIVMGKKYVLEQQKLAGDFQTQKSQLLDDTKKNINVLKGFLQGGLQEFKQDVRKVKTGGLFKKSPEKQPTPYEEG
ncbi:MAG: hypothetical protein LBP53_05025 [Candidatus Peribacteria bacterium]|jgi:hypothetical protein|nr:hypothetical protein [Candidatus Peribacteria bacterium]